MATIRERITDDLVNCVKLLRDVHETAGYPINCPADPKRWLTPPDGLGCFVITLNGEVAGRLALSENAGTAIVERLFVDPRRTGHGFGRQLLGYAVQVAGDRPLMLEVADNCMAAIALYRRAGWTEGERTPVDWGADRASACDQLLCVGGARRQLFERIGVWDRP